MPIKCEKLIVAEDYEGVDNLERVAWRESELWFKKEGIYKSSAELKIEQKLIEGRAKEKKMPEKKARTQIKFIEEKIKERDKIDTSSNFWSDMNARLDSFSKENMEMERKYYGNVPEHIQTALIKKYYELRKSIDEYNEGSEKQKEKEVGDEVKKIADI